MKQTKTPRPLDVMTAAAAAPAAEPEKFVPSPELQEAIAAAAPVPPKPSPELLAALRQAVNDLHHHGFIGVNEARAIKERLDI